MTSIQLFACIGMVTGFFILLRLSPMEFTDGVFRSLTSRPKSLKDEINELTHRKKKSFLRREIADTQNILKMTGREPKFPAICAMSLLLFVVGASAAIMMGNFFLVPVMAVGMMFVPFWFIKLTASYYKKNIAAELETALSIITTAYLRNEDIQTAVEENLEYLNPPVKSVFAEFLARIQLVDPDVDAALQDMGTKIDNAVFREWVAALLACQHDRGLKTILTPIVAKLSDMRIVNGELENMVFEPRKEFIIMQVLVVGNIPLLYFLNRDWFNTLMHTAMGQIILAVCAGVIFVSTAFVMVESYKRNAGPTFAAELDILTADMRSGSYEAALTRFEARFNSPLLSDVIRGLIGVLRGDNGVAYFQMLSHDMKQLELQRLKAQAMKIPPKIRVFSFLMLMCFLMTYLAIIVYEIITSLGGMF